MKTPAVLAALLTAALVVAEPLVREAETGDEPALATLDDVAWLEGRWEGEALGGDVTEVYARTSATQMVGLFTLAKAGQAVFHEFVIVEERDSSLLFRIKHFDADFSEWERLGETVDMPLIEVDDTAAHFSGMSFLRTGDASMQVQLLIDQDGKRRLEYFDYRRAAAR